MPVIHIPAALRHLSGDRARIEVAGTNLRQVFDALERECPGLTARIIEDGDLRTDMAVAIDGAILEGGGLIQPVSADAEIYLVPPIGGGSDRPPSRAQDCAVTLATPATMPPRNAPASSGRGTGPRQVAGGPFP